MEPSTFRILVVDDVEDNCDLLQRRLARKGFQVETAYCGPEALGTVAAGGIDLVVLDVMMPGMSGNEVLATLRRQYDPQTLPVIMATARTDPREVAAALDAGANDYVSKPIDLDVLVARIKVALRGRRGESGSNPLPTAPHAAAPPIAAPPGAGDLLDGRYALERRIGHGGFGAVFRARHVALDAPVAVKVMHEHLAANPVMRQRFAREGVSACRVRHPNAVSVYDAGITADGTPYLAMELLDGTTLADVMRARGALDAGAAAAVLIPVCAALMEAHRTGVVHRDVAPGNVFIARTATGAVVKVLDFGLARIMDAGADALSANDSLVGTVAYMAPERIRGEESGPEADAYSVGCVAYQCLTGALPYEKKGSVLLQALHQSSTAPRPIDALRPALPEALRAAVMGMLRASPDERLSLHALVQVLRALPEVSEDALDAERHAMLSSHESGEAGRVTHHAISAERLKQPAVEVAPLRVKGDR